MENTERTLEMLNDLVLINNDRIENYERALKEVEQDDNDKDLEPVFLRLIDNSRRYKMEIGTEIQALGKDIEQGTTIGGKLHRAWLAVKEAFNGHGRYEILDECESVEDAIRNAYQEALGDDVLPAYIIDMLDGQMQEILQAHDEIKSLRDSVH
ncbi:MAG TPA: PA2169 family four-helix-bundle protein [Mucilaginibacter sp.]|jgi:uncharacterized protein (TIGR02284 family)|nr:PA2169 family four-helix-bundle protein [Mucilaginibacter sp.]